MLSLLDIVQEGQKGQGMPVAMAALLTGAWAQSKGWVCTGGVCKASGEGLEQDTCRVNTGKALENVILRRDSDGPHTEGVLRALCHVILKTITYVLVTDFQVL